MLSKSREKSSCESLRRIRCFIWSIRSNPNKTDWSDESSMRRTHALTLRAELNATTNCSPESAGDAEISTPTFSAFERGVRFSIVHFFFFSSSCLAFHSIACRNNGQKNRFAKLSSDFLCRLFKYRYVK